MRVLELLVPCLVEDFRDEVLACRVCRFVEGTVILPGFLFSFGLVEFCSRCVPVNCVIVECDDRRDLICSLLVYMLVPFR